MRTVLAGILLLQTGVADLSVQAGIETDPAIQCVSCADWNVPQEPFRVHGNTYYVGTAGLSSVLITSEGGHVLIDGALPQSVPQIAANIRRLGFRLGDVKLLLNSHAHFDHAGGLAALRRATGADVAASPASARALEAGTPQPDDPQYGFGHAANAFPAVPVRRIIRDGETLRIGGVALTAQFTPGHTPGGTSWTWVSCAGRHCLHMVYGDSLSAVSAPGYRFRDSAAGKTLRASLGRFATLPCDVLLVTHPGNFGMAGKYARLREESGKNPFIDPQACRDYAAQSRRYLEKRLAEEGG